MGDILFRPLGPAERDRLRACLRRNVTDGAALLTGLDTSPGVMPIWTRSNATRAASGASN